MACKYYNGFEITYSYGGHLQTYEGKLFYEDVLQVSRCCILKPQWYIPSSSLLKADDVFNYLIALPDAENIAEMNPSITPEHPMCNGNKCMPSKNVDVKEVIVGLSYACNLNCFHCWYAGHHKDSSFQKELYFHTLYGLKNHELNKITLTNKGEPFFYFDETMKYLQSLSLNDTKEISAVTNGNCFDKEGLDRIKDILSNSGIKLSMVFSIDAISEPVYRLSRNGGDFEKVLKNLETSVKNFGENGIIVSFTCKKTNIQEVKKVKEFYKERFGVKTDITFDYFDSTLETTVQNM